MSDTTRAALAQALEALREATTYTGSAAWSPSMTRDCEAAIAAAEAALAAPQGEPLAWMDDGSTGGYGQPTFRVVTSATKAGMSASVASVYKTPLYAAPAAPARAEPTDAEIDALIARTWGDISIAPQSVRAFARAVLALRDGGKA